MAVFAQLQEFARLAPNWIVGDPAPAYTRLVERLRKKGAVGPLWSYFSTIQRLWPQGVNGRNEPMKKLLLISPLSRKSLMGDKFFFRMPCLGLLKVAALTPSDWQITIVDEKSRTVGSEPGGRSGGHHRHDHHRPAGL